MNIYTKTKNIANVLSSLLGQSKNLRKNYLPVKSLDKLVRKHYVTTSAQTKTLDLGCGSKPRNPFQAKELFGVDIRGDLKGNIRQSDLSAGPIPFADNMFNFCTAFDFIEHIPRNTFYGGKSRLAFLELMNEIYRVLKPGGILLHFTPAFPSKEAFQDPTHVNIITEDTMPNYFCEPLCWAKKLGYGFNGSFELIEQRWHYNEHLVGIMKALK